MIEENAAQAISDGFSILKIKVGRLQIEEDALRVHKVRQIAWFEEPVLLDDFFGYREVRDKLDMRIAGS